MTQATQLEEASVVCVYVTSLVCPTKWDKVQFDTCSGSPPGAMAVPALLHGGWLVPLSNDIHNHDDCIITLRI